MKWVSYDEFNAVFGLEETGGGYWQVEEATSSSFPGESNPFYGLKHTEESKAQMKESAKKRDNTPMREGVKRRYTKRYEFLNPEGKRVIHIGTMSDFCKPRGLNIKSMFDVNNGRYSQHHGWRKA